MRIFAFIALLLLAGCVAADNQLILNFTMDQVNATYNPTDTSQWGHNGTLVWGDGCGGTPSAGCDQWDSNETGCLTDEGHSGICSWDYHDDSYCDGDVGYSCGDFNSLPDNCTAYSSHNDQCAYYDTDTCDGDSDDDCSQWDADYAGCIEYSYHGGDCEWDDMYYTCNGDTSCGDQTGVGEDACNGMGGCNWHSAGNCEGDLDCGQTEQGEEGCTSIGCTWNVETPYYLCGGSLSCEQANTTACSNAPGCIWVASPEALYVSGKVGDALTFNGLDTRVKIAPIKLSAYSAWTFSAWVKIPADKGNNALYWEGDGSGGSGEGDFNIYLKEGGEYRMHSEETSGTGCQNSWGSGSDIPNGAWTHIAFAKNTSDNYTYYRNGQPRNVGTCVTTPSARNQSYLSGYDYWANQYFSGILDELLVYNRSLSDAEMLTLYNSYGGVSCPQPISGENWAIDCSQTCVYENINLNIKNITVTGSGGSLTTANFTMTSSWFSLPQTCSFNLGDKTYWSMEAMT